jgi:predicted nucleic acid-binding protein
MSGSVKRRICILDAGPLIHLNQLGKLDLLFNLGSIFIPESVAYEAERHQPGIREIIAAFIVEDFDGFSERLASALLDFGIDAGEIAALAWAEKFGADLFVSDDGDARVVATNLGYESTGTLGVIRNAYIEAVLTKDAAVSLLRAIPVRTTLHVKASLLDDVIASLR